MGLGLGVRVGKGGMGRGMGVQQLFQNNDFVFNSKLIPLARDVKELFLSATAAGGSLCCFVFLISCHHAYAVSLTQLVYHIKKETFSKQTSPCQSR